jgi:hypothetical protein
MAKLLACARTIPGDDAAEAAKDLGWGEWLTPAEFKLNEGAQIKAVRP